MELEPLRPDVERIEGNARIGDVDGAAIPHLTAWGLWVKADREENGLSGRGLPEQPALALASDAYAVLSLTGWIHSLEAGYEWRYR